MNSMASSFVSWPLVSMVTTAFSICGSRMMRLPVISW